MPSALHCLLLYGTPLNLRRDQEDKGAEDDLTRDEPAGAAVSYTGEAKQEEKEDTPNLRAGAGAGEESGSGIAVPVDGLSLDRVSWAPPTENRKESGYFPQYRAAEVAPFMVILFFVFEAPPSL